MHVMKEMPAISRLRVVTKVNRIGLLNNLIFESFLSDYQVQWENLLQLMSPVEWLLLRQRRRLLCILDVLFHQREVDSPFLNSLIHLTDWNAIGSDHPWTLLKTLPSQTVLINLWVQSIFLCYDI